MAGVVGEIALTVEDLREAAAFAAGCAEPVLNLFETDQPDDRRPAEAIDAAWEFARGGKRGKRLRDTAWAAMKAAKTVRTAVAHEAAWAAGLAAGAAYLHPLANATQVKHIVGSGARAARAAELQAGDDHAVGTEQVALAVCRATPRLIDVLKRYPVAPAGGGRVGELMRLLDAELRLCVDDA